MDENIKYDVGQLERLTELPVDSIDKNYTFEFIGFEAMEYHAGGKPYVFYATMTQEKKTQLEEERKLDVEKDKDDKQVEFIWGDIIWHFDLFLSDWKRLVEENAWLPGRIYFVRESNEEIITPDNFQEKTRSLKQVQKVNQRTQSDIVNDAIATLQQAWEIIDLIKDGTFMPFDVMKAQALKQYHNQDKTRNIIIPKIKILITTARWYSPHEGETPVELTSQLETVFLAAANNFKNTVESFSNHNVIVDLDVYIIENTSSTPIVGIGGETLTPEKPYEGNYVTFSQVKEAIEDKMAQNYYNACIFAITGDANPFTGVTLLRMFNNLVIEGIATNGMGFCSTSIINSEDEYEKAITQEYEDSGFCYLTSSALMVREWMHTLEDGYTIPEIMDGIVWNSIIQRVPPEDLTQFIYPFVNNYQYARNLEFPHYDFPDYCVENTDEQYDESREDLMSYYKAVLSGELQLVSGDETHYLGMFPKMWYLTPEAFATGVIWDFRQQNQNEKSQSE